MRLRRDLCATEPLLTPDDALSAERQRLLVDCVDAAPFSVRGGH